MYYRSYSTVSALDAENLARAYGETLDLKLLARPSGVHEEIAADIRDLENFAARLWRKYFHLG